MLPRETRPRRTQPPGARPSPTAIGGGPYGIVDDLYLRLVKVLGLGNLVPPFRSGHSISYMDDRLLDGLGSDIRYCWPRLLPNSPIIPVRKRTPLMTPTARSGTAPNLIIMQGGILKDAESLDDIERLVRWPDLADPRWTGGLAERARSCVKIQISSLLCAWLHPTVPSRPPVICAAQRTFDGYGLATGIRSGFAR